MPALEPSGAGVEVLDVHQLKAYSYYTVRETSFLTSPTLASTSARTFARLAPSNRLLTAHRPPAHEPTSPSALSQPRCAADHRDERARAARRRPHQDLQHSQGRPAHRHLRPVGIPRDSLPRLLPHRHLDQRDGCPARRAHHHSRRRARRLAREMCALGSALPHWTLPAQRCLHPALRFPSQARGTTSAPGATSARARTRATTSVASWPTPRPPRTGRRRHCHGSRSAVGAPATARAARTPRAPLPLPPPRPRRTLQLPPTPHPPRLMLPPLCLLGATRRIHVS